MARDIYKLFMWYFVFLLLCGIKVKYLKSAEYGSHFMEMNLC